MPVVSIGLGVQVDINNNIAVKILRDFQNLLKCRCSLEKKTDS